MDRRSLLKIATVGAVALGSNSIASARDKTSDIKASGRNVSISSIITAGMSDDDAISLAIKKVTASSGGVVINDLERALEIKNRQVFEINRSSLQGISSSAGVDKIGIIGHFVLTGGGGFDFIGCQYIHVDVLINGGDGNSITDTAIRMESGCVGASFKIIGNLYQGTLFGTFGKYNSKTSNGVQSVDDSKISAFSCGRAFYISGTTGFGTISTVWEEYPKGSSVITKSSDVTIGVYENFVPDQNSGCLVIEDCGSVTFGSLATGAWGQPQVKVSRTQTMAIGNHLSVLGNKDKNNDDVFALDIDAAIVSIGNSRLEKLGSGFRIGGGGTLNIANVTANFVNQLAYLGYAFDDKRKKQSAFFNAASVTVYRPNSSNCLKDKDLIFISDSVDVGCLVIENIKVIGMNFKRKDSASRIINSQSSSGNLCIAIGLSVQGIPDNKNFIYIKNIASLKRFISSGYSGEIDFNNGTTTGYGEVFSIADDKPSYNKKSSLPFDRKAKLYFIFSVDEGGNFEVLVNNSLVYCRYDAGKSSCVVDLQKGDSYMVRMSKCQVINERIVYQIA
ncbi:TPA: hypothetical protein QHV38_005091 [Klebsiella michiganensis]|nr:hypothetical protein [Klebsiella michiganensis]